MRVLVIDPGLAVAACAVFDVPADGAHRGHRLRSARCYVSAETVKTRPGKRLEDRLRELREWGSALVERYGASAAYIEIPPTAASYRRNQQRQRTKTDPGAADHSKLYMAISSIHAGLEIAGARVKFEKAAYAKKAYKAAWVDETLTLAGVEGGIQPRNQHERDAAFLGLSLLVGGRVPSDPITKEAA